jgi:hypothetical protein
MQCFVTYDIGLFLQIPLASSQCLLLLVTLLVLKSTRVLRAEMVPGAIFASSARRGTALIEQSISWSWLEGQGTISKKDRRKSQLCA